MINFKCILSHGAELPTRAHSDDVGLDLRIKGYQNISPFNERLMGEPVWFDTCSSTNYITLDPNTRILAKTGLQIAIPECERENYKYEIQVRPRSGMALKHGLTVLNTPGTIDPQYRGDIGVILLNTNFYPVKINNNDRIAQLIINEVLVNTHFEVVESFDDLTSRGSSGFGDSGKN